MNLLPSNHVINHRRISQATSRMLKAEEKGAQGFSIARSPAINCLKTTKWEFIGAYEGFWMLSIYQRNVSFVVKATDTVLVFIKRIH